jgi:uncharacterized membrane protein YtjA (UPF0391 family)
VWDRPPGASSSARFELHETQAAGSRKLSLSKYGTFSATNLEGRSLALVGKEDTMLYYALIFLVVGLIAGALGVSGVAAVASQIAWVLFVIGIVLLIVHLISGRRTMVP